MITTPLTDLTAITATIAVISWWIAEAGISEPFRKRVAHRLELRPATVFTWWLDGLIGGNACSLCLTPYVTAAVLSFRQWGPDTWQTPVFTCGLIIGLATAATNWGFRE